MYTADTLSRTPVASPGEIRQKQQEDEMFVSAITEALPTSETRLGEYKEQNIDPECRAVKKYCRIRWPQKYKVPSNIKEYWKVRGTLTINDLLMAEFWYQANSASKHSKRSTRDIKVLDTAVCE